MKNLFQLIIRYHFFLLFLLLEGMSFFFVIRYNHFQRASFNSFATSIEGYFYRTFGGVSAYLDLKEINDGLRHENNLLLNENDRLRALIERSGMNPDTSASERRYRYIPARVINNSVNKSFNYITLDRGERDGIAPEMGVVSPDGVVGIVFSVSRHFSTVLPVLNLNFRLSAKLKKNEYFGSLHWTGPPADQAEFTDLPGHVNVAIGDTVVTSGYSSIFPEGILVGTVTDFTREEGSFQAISVRLSVNFRKLTHVNVIGNLVQEEQMELENNKVND